MPTINTETIGSAGGRNFSEPSAWWYDKDGQNLVSGDVIERGEIYNDSTVTTGGTYTFYSTNTTDATRYLHLRAASGESPAFQDTGSGFTFPWYLTSGSNYYRIEGDITVTKAGSGSGTAFVQDAATGTHVNGLTIVNNTTSTDTNTNCIQTGLMVSSLLANVVAYFGDSFAGAGSVYVGNDSLASSNAIEHCVFDGANLNWYAMGRTGSSQVRNCVVIAGSSAATFGTLSDVDYCATDAGSGLGSNSVYSITPSSEFADYANNDYHLGGSLNLDGAGTATGITVTTDHDGVTYGSPRDIGAFNYAAAPATGQRVFIIS